MKVALYLLALIIGSLLWTAAASAHAVLITAEPQDGAVLAAAPRQIKLTFSEPVAPLILRLLKRDGSIVRLSDYQLESETLTINLPTLPGSGSNILSWRVASQDGHPVGGSLTFSVDQTTAVSSESGDEARVGRVPIWAARFVMLACLTLVVGGALFDAWIFPLDRKILGNRTLLLALPGGAAVVANFAFQLADALGGTFQNIADIGVWLRPVAGSFGLASGLALLALVLALLAVNVGRRAARICSALSFLMTGLAFASSGHASTAAPQLLMRPTVFLHTLGISFWIGSLVPLFLVILGFVFLLRSPAR